MSTRADIRAAFKRHGPLSVTELAPHCPSCERDRQIVASEIARLRVEGKVKTFGTDAQNKPVYTIDHWPESETESSAERATVRATTPATSPAPVSAAVPPQQENHMNPVLQTRVRNAIKASAAGLTRSEINSIAGDERDAEEVIQALLKSGEVKRTGHARGTRYISNGAPPQGPRTPPAKKARKVRHRRRVVRRKKPRALRQVAPERPPAPPANGKGAHFAINEHGELGITKGKDRMALEPSEFARLRGFIDRTEPVWKGAST